MSAFRGSSAYVMKSILKNKDLKPKLNTLCGMTFIISGGTRGIGFSMAREIVNQGGNVTILGKTTVPHPKLDNTIYSAADKINASPHARGSMKCLGIP